MKITKDSWHYRFNNWQNAMFEYHFDTGRYTTCSYIRTTIGSAFSAFFKGLTALCFLGIFLFIAGSMLIVPAMVFMGQMPPEMPAVVCVTSWAIAAFVLLILFVRYTTEWFESRRNSSSQSKEPNVFVQAIIDKHNKYCTRVTAE